MSYEICIHDNVKETCNRCNSKCWQLVSNVTNGYYLTEFYTGKMKKIPKKYFAQISKLIRDKSKYHSKVCDCETLLQEIIGKVVNK